MKNEPEVFGVRLVAGAPRKHAHLVEDWWHVQGWEAVSEPAIEQGYTTIRLKGKEARPAQEQPIAAVLPLMLEAFKQMMQVAPNESRLRNLELEFHELSNRVALLEASAAKSAKADAEFDEEILDLFSGRSSAAASGVPEDFDISGVLEDLE